MIKPEVVQLPGTITREEIFRQPELWKDTLERVSQSSAAERFRTQGKPSVIAGAGTSAYVALAIESALSNSRAIATTDLLIDVRPWLQGSTKLLSVARSGDSPESCGVIQRVQRLEPTVAHFAITCNADGSLAVMPGVDAIVLDARTNDRSLVMTSAFSNLTLAGLALENQSELGKALPRISDAVSASLDAFEHTARQLASRPNRRFVALSSRPMFACALEASLKVLEMTAGKIPVLAETFLGLRHGPMSFLEPDTLVLAFISSDPHRRKYEQDLLAELRTKRLGVLIAVMPEDFESKYFDIEVRANSPGLADGLRTPFEIVFAQILGVHLSLAANLNPDSPSPHGVISRVVQGVRVHEN